MVNLKKSINIFLPEDSGKRGNCNSTEYHYFNFLFSRNLKDDYILRFFPKDQEKDFKKKLDEDDTEFSAVILDFDFRENSDNLEVQKKEISNYAKMIESSQNAELYLTSRAWEVWICMHNSTYTKPFVSQEELNKDIEEEYSKSKQWYKNKVEYLTSNLDTAIKNAKSSRKSLMFECEGYIQDKPDFRDPGVLQQLYVVNTFTYIDFLITKLKNYISN